MKEQLFNLNKETIIKEDLLKYIYYIDSLKINISVRYVSSVRQID